MLRILPVMTEVTDPMVISIVSKAFKALTITFHSITRHIMQQFNIHSSNLCNLLLSSNLLASGEVICITQAACYAPNTGQALGSSEEERRRHGEE